MNRKSISAEDEPAGLHSQGHLPEIENSTSTTPSPATHSNHVPRIHKISSQPASPPPNPGGAARAASGPPLGGPPSPSPMPNENCSMLDARWNPPTSPSVLNPLPKSEIPSGLPPKPKRSKHPKRPIRRRPHPSTPDRASVKHRPISRIAGLTTDQLDQLAAWHLQDGLSIDACAQRATAQFNPPRPIPKTSIQRFLEHRRTANPPSLNLNLTPNPNPVNLVNPVKTSPSASSAPSRALCVDSASLQTAATEINHYAATGSTDFSPATLFLLEQKAFQLTHHLQTFAPEKPEQIHQHIRPLKDLCLLINKAKNTAIRERHAAVQEEKCALRRDELKARRIEVEVRERQRQEQLDLQRDQLQLNRDNSTSKSNKPRKPTILLALRAASPPEGRAPRVLRLVSRPTAKRFIKFVVLAS